MNPARQVLHALPLIGALLASGCGGTVQTYEGPKKPSDQTAILKTNVGEFTFDTVWIDQVDDQTLVRAYSELELAQGRHALRIQLSSGVIKARTTLSFEAKAGRTYRVRGSIGSNGPVAWIEDERTGETITGVSPR